MNTSTLNNAIQPSFWRQNYFGLATMAPLDYGSRYEHSAVVVPRDWEAMYDLIYSPQTFMEGVRNSYGLGTPKFLRKNGSLETAEADRTIIWTFADPITIVIRPLTQATQQNRQIMSLLNGYYPFQKVLDDWDTLAPNAFREEVIKAALDPQNPPQYEVDVPCKGTVVNLEPWSEPFPLKFVAEFAIDTRVLHISYLPQDTNPWPDDPNRSGPPYYTNTITPVTWSRVGATTLHYLHFDVDFAGSHTYDRVAQIRAQIAIDYIVGREQSLNAWMKRINMTPNLNPAHTADPGDFYKFDPGEAAVKLDENGFFFCDGSLVEAGQMRELSQSFRSSQPPPQFTTPRRDPSVIIDSVWPIPPSDIPEANESPNQRMNGDGEDPPPPPPPYLCVNVTTEGEEPGDATIKWYQAGDEEEGGP